MTCVVAAVGNEKREARSEKREARSGMRDARCEMRDSDSNAERAIRRVWRGRRMLRGQSDVRSAHGPKSPVTMKK